MSFWSVHGRDPEPVQQPRLAGAITAAAAAIPAATLVWVSGAAASPAAAIGLPKQLLVLLSIAALVLAGIGYGAVFLRAANDRRGGWLFGLGWGFLAWALGPITFSQWWLGSPVAVGRHAAILLAAHLLWGVLLGFVFPFIQHVLELNLGEAASPRRLGLDRQNRFHAPPAQYSPREGDSA